MDLTDDFSKEVYRKVFISDFIDHQMGVFNDVVTLWKNNGHLSKDFEKIFSSDFEEYIEKLYELSEELGMKFTLNHVHEVLPKNRWTLIYGLLRSNNFFGRYTLISKEQEVEFFEKKLAAEKDDTSFN